MANFNRVIMAGNMTRDPQLSFLPSNTPVVDFGLATNRRWRGQDGQYKEDTCFVDCKVFGRAAETINQYMAKGRSILVEGRLQFQQWSAKDGTKRSKHVVVVENFQFLDGRRGDQAADAGQNAVPAAEMPREQADQGPHNAGAPAAADGDIPF